MQNASLKTKHFFPLRIWTLIWALLPKQWNESESAAENDTGFLNDLKNLLTKQSCFTFFHFDRN